MFKIICALDLARSLALLVFSTQMWRGKVCDILSSGQVEGRQTHGLCDTCSVVPDKTFQSSFFRKGEYLQDSNSPHLKDLAACNTLPCLPHSTVHANQVAEFKHFTLVESVRSHQRNIGILIKALEVARGRMEYEKLLPNQRKAVETFVCLLAGYRKSFVMATFHHIQPFVLFITLCSWSSASLPHAKHQTDTAP